MVLLALFWSSGRTPGLSHTMGDEAAEVPANNAMPCCTLPLVELSPVSVNRKRVAVLRRTVRLMW